MKMKFARVCAMCCLGLAGFVLTTVSTSMAAIDEPAVDPIPKEYKGNYQVLKCIYVRPHDHVVDPASVVVERIVITGASIELYLKNNVLLYREPVGLSEDGKLQIRGMRESQTSNGTIKKIGVIPMSVSFQELTNGLVLLVIHSHEKHIDSSLSTLYVYDVCWILASEKKKVIKGN